MREPASAGRGRPARAIRAQRPTAVMVTVFPPALGPLMISACAGAGSATSLATTPAGLRWSTSSGCRALRSSKRSPPSSGAPASRSSPRPPPDGAGQLMEDALLLLQRAGLGDGELVAQLHQLLRLDEQRLPGVGGVVHDPRQMRPVLGAHRQHVAVPPHRVVGVPEHGNDLLVLEQLLDPLLDGAVEAAGALAQLAEKGARGVEQLSGGVERALQLLRERDQLGQLLRLPEVERSAVRLRETEPAR